MPRFSFLNVIILTVFAWLMLSPYESRADTWLVATLASYHTDRDVDHCERNPGLGVEVDVAPRWRAAGGFYLNSYCKQTVYTGAVRNLANDGKWHFGVLLGGVTGYDAGITPVIMPVFSYEEKRWGVNIGVMPALDAKIIGIVGLQLKARF